MKQSMIFYASWKEAIKGLPDGVRLEVYEAAVDFAMTGNVPELSAMAAMVFPFIRQDIERDMENYDRLCNRNRANGMKGGRPRKNPENPVGILETQQNPEKTTETQETQANPNEDISNDISLSSKEKNSLQSSKRKSAEADPTAAGKEEKADAPDFRKLADFFNDELRRNGSIIPTIRSIDGQRRSSTMARIREHGKPAFAEAVKKAAASDFLNGKNDRGWVADFDWIIKPNNFIKVLEGNYDNRQQNNNQRYGNTGKHNQRSKGGNPEDGYESSL